jgi:hypothetical protein
VKRHPPKPSYARPWVGSPERSRQTVGATEEFQPVHLGPWLGSPDRLMARVHGSCEACGRNVEWLEPKKKSSFRP